MFSFGADKQTARVASEFYVNAINVMRGAESVSGTRRYRKARNSGSSTGSLKRRSCDGAPSPNGWPGGSRWSPAAALASAGRPRFGWPPRVRASLSRTRTSWRRPASPRRSAERARGGDPRALQRGGCGEPASPTGSPAGPGGPPPGSLRAADAAVAVAVDVTDEDGIAGAFRRRWRLAGSTWSSTMPGCPSPSRYLRPRRRTGICSTT